MKAPIVLALLLGLAGGLVDAQGPSGTPTAPAGPDLAVTAVQVAQPGPEWREGQPRNGTVAVEIANFAAVPATYRVDVAWRSPGGAPTPLNGEAVRSFDVSREPLPPGARRTETFPWSLQPGQAGPGAVVAQVNAGDGTDPRPADNVRETATFVPVRDVRLSLEGPALSLGPGATGFHRVRMTNLGNVAEPVELSAAPVEEDPRLRHLVAPDRLVVPPGATAAAALLVTFVPDGDFAPFATAYDVEARTGFGAPLAAQTPAAHPASEAPGTSGFAFALDAPASASVGSGRGILPVVVRNLGRADNYTVQVSAAAGWEATAAPDRVALFAGEDARVDVLVQAPPGLPAGAQAPVTVTLRGSLGTTREATSTVRVGGPAPQPTLLGLAAAPYVGEPIVLLARLHNAGDAPLGATLARATWAQGAASGEAAAEVGPLPPGASRDLALTLPPPAGPGTLEVALQWPAGASPVTLASSAHEPRLQLVLPASQAAPAGTLVTYAASPHAPVVRNAGVDPEPVVVRAGPEGIVGLRGPAAFTLAPGEERSVPITVQLPRPAGDTTAVAATLHVSILGHAYGVEGVVTTAVVDAEPPRVTWPPTPPLWAQDEPLPIHVDAEDDVGVSTVQVRVASGGLERSIPLTRGGSGWNATLLLAVGNHTLSVEATDAAGHRVSLPPRLLQVEAVPPPTLSVVLEESAREAVLRIQVADPRPARVRVLVEEGGAWRPQDLMVVDGNASVSLSKGSAPLRVQVEAVNDAGARSLALVDVPAVAPDDAEPLARPPRDASGAPGVAATAAVALALALASRRAR